MDKAKQQGQFFTFPANAVRSIISAQGGTEEIISLLILYRGAGRYSSSGWSLNAIAEKGGFSYGRAKKCLSFLCALGFVEEKQPDPKANKDKPEAGHKWKLLKTEDDPIYLPNALIDGVQEGRKRPPMVRLYLDIKSKPAKGIDTAVARLDALTVLLAFYKEHDISQYGGVNPHYWFEQWVPSDDEYYREIPIPGSNGVFHEIDPDTERAMSHKMIEVMPDMSEEERDHRYWHAIKNLRDLGLAYKVLQVWTKNPLQSQDAEVLYPLYIFDQRARASEPTTYREINSLAIDDHGSERFFDSDGTSQFGETVSSFRFVAVKGKNHVAGCVLRLRYRPHDRDTGRGMEEQANKANEWTVAIRKMRGVGGFE